LSARTVDANHGLAIEIEIASERVALAGDEHFAAETSAVSARQGKETRALLTDLIRFKEEPVVVAFDGRKWIGHEPGAQDEVRLHFEREPGALDVSPPLQPAKI
jgi:hypothetical protein